jgi:seryl-tRNA synthetase
MHKQDSQSIVIEMDKALHPELVSEVEKQSVYISTSLLDLKVQSDLKRIALIIEAGREEELTGKVKRFLAAIQHGFRPVEMKTVAVNERKNTRPYETGVYEQLVKKGWVLGLGQGQVGLAGPALALAQALDKTIVRAAQDKFGATERTYPALIPAEVLARCGYTSSFPQHLSIVTHLEENYDAIEKFRAANVDRRDIAVPEAKAFGHPKVCLCPALCYHCYPTLEGKVLPVEGHVETSTGRIARYESTSMVGLDRLWEFAQRSIIWLGGDHFCAERRVLAMETAMELARTWDIDCRIETASDPFFTSVSTAKSFWQKGQDLKFEMRAFVEPNAGESSRTIAAASFNLHSTYFGEAFDISDHTGGPAFSGCASWGIERLLLVIYTQHGLDQAQWPESLRSLVANPA